MICLSALRRIYTAYLQAKKQLFIIKKLTEVPVYYERRTFETFGKRPLLR
jgi:hypothetical protein